MKRVFSLLVVLIMSLNILTGCGEKSDESTDGDSKKKEYELNIGTVTTEADPLFAGLKVFQENVSERTNGAVKIKLFASSQLGSDEDVLEQAKVGAGVGIITDPGRLSLYKSDFGILGAPYLVDDYDEALKLLETSVFKDLSDQFAQDGFKILSYNYFQGTRHLFTKEPVSTPEDLSGLRVRSSGSDIVTETVKNMGANPTVIAWSEAYPGLQQKVIDGVEVHYSAAVGASIYEVTDYLTKTGHFQLLTGLVISNDWFEKLPEEYQTILIEEAYNGGKHASELVLEKEAEFEKQLVESGLEIIEADIDAFKEAVKPAYEKLGYGELKEQIDIELGKK